MRHRLRNLLACILSISEQKLVPNLEHITKIDTLFQLHIDEYFLENCTGIGQFILILH